MSLFIKIFVFFILFIAAIVWFERANLYFPTRVWDGTPDAAGLSFESVVFRSSDGVDLSGWLIHGQDGPLKTAGLTILLFHGNGGNISHRLEKARILARLGLQVFLVDYRGYGHSQGHASEKGTYLDGKAAYDWLVREKRLTGQQIVLYGESLGCAVAVETALHNPSRAIILESPFTSTVEMARRFFSFLPVRWMVFDRYDNLAKIPKLTVPLLVMHSPADETVPFAMGTTLYEKAPEPKAFCSLAGGHNDGFLQAGPRYPKAIASFLTHILEARPFEKS